MTPAELAVEEVRVAREKAAHADVEARRLDWLDEHKVEIQKDLGIDPSLTWEYDEDGDDHSQPDVEVPDT